VLFDSKGIKIIQPNTSFLLLKYTYIQGYTLHGSTELKHVALYISVF